MVKLSWQIVVVMCVAMVCCAALIITSYFVTGAEEMRNYAWILFAAIASYGGGKVQTAWEIRKMNGNGGSDGGSS